MSEPKMSAKLSLFTAFAESFSSDGASRSPARSPRRRSFDDDGLVGLGIVAALNEQTPPERVVVSAVSPRSRPIPIRPSGGGGEGRRERVVAEDMLSEAEMMSESYTCVISHVGGKAVRRCVYFEGDFGGGGGGDLWEDLGVVFEQPPPQEVEEMGLEVGFLSHCFLCKKNLHGLDIFMYRGEKAFCSVECRSYQIQSDEYREKCGSEAMKTFDCSVSPCSAPLHFSAGIAAA
ncbi:hypothetical protein QJS04_geneDACA004152 [Acorus gramineus]|uniref:FLZ-type domain-containing protein n=1 Tax=Acorus gramineus TaxID=55184 RepID=A0AAV9BJL5_ACOGR|nr:hypothetical protein QJS04_geneDACA004152 [Acorus gramineus]